MSIASELQRIIAAKTAIIQSIINKGVEVPEEAKIEDLADLIGQIGPGPTPSDYHYSLLLNWVDNVGPEPIWSGAGNDWKVLTEFIEGMDNPESDWDQQSSSNKYEFNYYNSTTVGDRLSDTRNPIDFTSYGITGSTPFGLVTWYKAYDDYVFSYENVFSTANDGKFTVEFWYAMSPEEIGTDYSPTSYLCQLSNDNWDNVFFKANHDTYGDEDYFELDFSSTISIPYTKSEIGTSWHHYAITSDGDKIYVFIDGIKKAEETLTTADKTYLEGIKHYTYSTQGSGYVLWGRLSQIAICDECKWTSNFTVPTVAYRNST